MTNITYVKSTHTNSMNENYDEYIFRDGENEVDVKYIICNLIDIYNTIMTNIRPVIDQTTQINQCQSQINTLQNQISSMGIMLTTILRK